MTDQTELQELAERCQFLKLTKTGKYLPRKSKKDATHRIEVTTGSILVTPLKRWPKHKKFKPIPRYSHLDMNLHDIEIPPGATHLQYIAGRTAIIAPIICASDYAGPNYRGKLRYGKYFEGSDRFESMMPEDKDPGEPVSNVLNHRAMRKPDVPAAPKAPEAPKAPKAAPTSKPTAPKRSTGAVSQIWHACDVFRANNDRCPTKAELVEVLPDLNPGTVNTQLSAWRRHHGLPKP